jgi:hypothetical protein
MVLVGGNERGGAKRVKENKQTFPKRNKQRSTYYSVSVTSLSQILDRLRAHRSHPPVPSKLSPRLSSSRRPTQQKACEQESSSKATAASFYSSCYRPTRASMLSLDLRAGAWPEGCSPFVGRRFFDPISGLFSFISSVLML